MSATAAQNDTLAAEPRIARLGDLIDELYNDSGRAWLAIAEGRLLGPPIMFETVSRELGGYWPPGLHVLHAGAGCGKSAFAIQSASVAAAQHCAVIYVSCDAQTLGRDLAVLEGSYALTSVATFEMFPQTSHVEIVAALERRRS